MDEIHLIRTLTSSNMLLLNTFLQFLTVQAVYSLSETDVTKVIRASKSLVKGSNLPTMVRLTFHDCVGKYIKKNCIRIH